MINFWCCGNGIVEILFCCWNFVFVVVVGWGFDVKLGFWGRMGWDGMGWVRMLCWVCCWGLRWVGVVCRGCVGLWRFFLRRLFWWVCCFLLCICSCWLGVLLWGCVRWIGSLGCICVVGCWVVLGFGFVLVCLVLILVCCIWLVLVIVWVFGWLWFVVVDCWIVWMGIVVVLIVEGLCCWVVDVCVCGGWNCFFVCRILVVLWLDVWLWIWGLGLNMGFGRLVVFVDGSFLFLFGWVRRCFCFCSGLVCLLVWLFLVVFVLLWFCLSLIFLWLLWFCFVGLLGRCCWLWWSFYCDCGLGIFWWGVWFWWCFFLMNLGI